MEPSLGRRALQPLEKLHTPVENVSEGKCCPCTCVLFSRKQGPFSGRESRRWAQGHVAAGSPAMVCSRTVQGWP